MTHMYGARGSFALLLKTKKHDQTASTKCIGPGLYGKMGFTKFSNFFQNVLVLRFVSDLFKLARPLR